MPTAMRALDKALPLRARDRRLLVAPCHPLLRLRQWHETYHRARALGSRSDRDWAVECRDSQHADNERADGEDPRQPHPCQARRPRPRPARRDRLPDGPGQGVTGGHTPPHESQERPSGDVRAALTVSGKEGRANRRLRRVQIVGVAGCGIDVTERFLDRTSSKSPLPVPRRPSPFHVSMRRAGRPARSRVRRRSSA